MLCPCESVGCLEMYEQRHALPEVPDRNVASNYT